MSNTRIEDYIKAVFAKNEALYGDARMELVEEVEVKSGVEPITDPPADESVEEPEGESTEGEPKPEGDELPPEVLRKELTSARAEAANYRTKLRDAEAKLSEAKTPEEVEAAISELRETNAKLERQILVNKVATKHNLPEELAARLKGDTPEELEADAKTLALFAAPSGDPESLEGGLDPRTEDDGEMDPRKLASRFRRI